MQKQQQFDFRKYLNLLATHQRLFAAVSLGVMTVVFIVSYLLPKKYEAKSTVFIEKSVIAELAKGIAVTPSIDDKLRVLNYSMTSRTLLLKVIEELDMNLRKMSDAELEQLIKRVQENLTVKLPKEKESLFVVTYRDSNPRLARDFVNVLVRRYIEENTSSKREDTYGASQFFSEQMKTFRERLDKAEEAVNEFKRKNSAMVSTDPGLLQREINDAQLKLDDLRIRRSQLEAQLASLRKVSPTAARISALQKQLDELRAQFTENYPEIQRLKSEIEGLKGGAGGRHGLPEQMEEEKILSEIRAIRQSEENLSSIIASNRALMRGVPAARARLEDLERERNAQKVLYEQMLAKQGQSEVSKQLEVQDKSANFRIVDPAVMPIRPVSPDRLRIMLMGILGGIGAACGVLLLIDQFDRSIKSLSEAKQLKIPILAAIPRIVDPAELAAERKRTIRTVAVSGVYFLVLLSFLGMEAAGVTLVDRAVNRLAPQALIDMIRDRVR